MRPKRIGSLFDEFLRLESAGGIILMIAAASALVLANTPLSVYYDLLISTPVAIQVGPLEIAKPLLLWINDGLMAVFFFLIGLELKRELLEGELSQVSKVILPAVGAIGGIAVPGLIYTWFNYGDEAAMQGWAIPTATDIAFALGIISLLGSRVPIGVKIFLTSLAIFDDIAAIVIIAVFYAANISITSLLFVGCCIVLLYCLNRWGVDTTAPFIVVGILMWVAMLKSGIHATLAGVILALFIPIKSGRDPDYSMLKSMEHDLHAAVAFIVLPVFAFANAGISLVGIGPDELFHTVPIGIAAGLFVGKQIGIFGACWIAIRLGMTSLPTGMNYTALFGTAALCGVGFTMSLFIGSLAFEASGVDLLFDERLGILLGSLASGGLGYLILSSCYKKGRRSEYVARARQTPTTPITTVVG